VKGRSGRVRVGAGRSTIAEPMKNRLLKANDEQWEIIKEFAWRLKKGEVEKTFIADLQKKKPSK